MKINAAQRVLRVWQALKGNTFTGLSNSEIAQMLDDSPANVSRALTTLIAEDLVTKLPSGRFAHSVKTLQIAAAHYDHTQRMKQRIDQMQRQISAGTR
ncbi:helix-turn-helix domain-containing protein [Oligella urethralis]|uniref:helix-turn-helix domain-containing protein n=1 Tax=Oligella urethralis TaxID=90245 RepID=UPI00288AC89D|nr:helix-turn-helix domain-containing protein [Oligella urethralis]